MRKNLMSGGALLAAVLSASNAFAVGAGVPFVFEELDVPALNHDVNANSFDLTYHACVDFVDNGIFNEVGYFWISSFQDVDSVVDSQINDFQANGYHLYGKYAFHGEECLDQMTCHANRTRKTYDLSQASISLYVDPLSNTTIQLMNCQVVVAGAEDDRPLGSASMLQSEMKTETDDFANGDFDLVFSNWVFTADGQDLFREPGGGNPLDNSTLVFNANVTRLQGPLVNDHRPEGSGNLFWRD
jgi:hypothetical protein